MKTIVVVGGGPSGIVAAIFAKRENNHVIVLEKNLNPLKKLLMTGNGKCNYLNEVYNTSYYHSEDIETVDKILTTKNIEKVKDFFDSIGIIPKIKNGYYYPYSSQASSVERALLKAVRDKEIEIIGNCNVTKIEKLDKGFSISYNEVVIHCDKVVLATGSCCVPRTGSDGWGYSFLKETGHTIVKPLPALVQLVGEGSYFKAWDGVRSDVRLELFENGNYVDSEEGEIQLTNYGISGICTFNLSHYVSRGLDKGLEEVIKINFVPFVDTLLTPWLDAYSKKHPTMRISELLEGFLNYKLVSVILKESNISPFEYYENLDNNQKLLLCKNLKSFPVKIVDTKGFENCQICSGGLKLTDISPKTMQSKKLKGLYVVGELLDMNGKCGGYNLTTCWITGMLAGESIGGKSDKSSSN